MSEEVQYKGFVIEADPELLETGQWSTYVEIHRHSGSRVSSRVFRKYETYLTQEEAVTGCHTAYATYTFVLVKHQRKNRGDE